MPSMGTHGVLVVGEDPIYLSHLPMFMSPHDFQVILEVGFDQAATKAYRDSRPTPGGEIYTLVPERFDIQELGPDAVHPRTSFMGTLFRGHFERGGTVLKEGVTVAVAGIAHFRHFEAHAPKLAELEYFTFGTGGQRYLAHLVTRAPDFDQILTVEIPDGDGRDGCAAGDARPDGPFTVPGSKNAVDQRIQAGTTAAGVLGTPDGGARVSVVAQAEIYLETGDLA